MSAWLLARERPRAQRGEAVTTEHGGRGQKSLLSMQIAEGPGETKHCLAREGDAHNVSHGNTQVLAPCVTVSPRLSPRGDTWKK